MPRPEPLSLPDAGLFLEPGIADAIGLPIFRTDIVDRGTFLLKRDHTGQAVRLTVGTRPANPYEAVRRETRRTVREGLARAGYVTASLYYEHLRQREDEDFLDQLVGSAPAWPT